MGRGLTLKYGSVIDWKEREGLVEIGGEDRRSPESGFGGARRPACRDRLRPGGWGRRAAEWRDSGVGATYQGVSAQGLAPKHSWGAILSMLPIARQREEVLNAVLAQCICETSLTADPENILSTAGVSRFHHGAITVPQCRRFILFKTIQAQFAPGWAGWPPVRHMLASQ
jgi:hypothetical protein